MVTTTSSRQDRISDRIVECFSKSTKKLSQDLLAANMTEISEEQKQALVDFWQARPHLAILGSSTALTPEVVELWKELALILNNCNGNEKPWKEWVTYWKNWRRKIERKITFQGKQLSHIETILAAYMFEPGGEHDNNRKEFITSEQKRKMIEFWKGYPDKKSIIRGSNAIRKRWQELAVILNNCEGKIRTWREWCVVWSDMKYRMRRNKATKNALEAKGGATEELSQAGEDQQIANIKSEATAGDDTFEGLENEYIRRRATVTTYEQKCKMLDYWERNMCYTGVGSSYEDYVKNWEELTQILNSDETDGPERSRKEWCKVWSDIKCQMKRKLLRREPETNFERRFDAFLKKNDGDDWRASWSNRRTKLYLEEEDNVLLLEPGMKDTDHLPKIESQGLREQRCRILEFWKLHPDYFICRPGLGRKFLKHRRILWEELTSILNRQFGLRKSRFEWMETWNGVTTKLRIRMSKQLVLSDFESELAHLLAKCEADSYNCRLRLAKQLKKIDETDEKNDAEAVFDRLDKKYSLGSKYDKLRERRRLIRIKAYQPTVFKITSNEQKEKLLQFWENHHLETNGTVVSKKKEIQKLWREVTEIMHSCEGPHRTWKEWSSLWSSLKVAVRRKIFNQTEITGDFDNRLAEYIRKSEFQTMKERIPDVYKAHCDPVTRDIEWQSVCEPKIEITTDPTDDYNYGDSAMRAGTELKVEYDRSDDTKSSQLTTHNGSPNMMQADIALKQQSLRMHRKNLLVQETILSRREELVQVVKEGIKLVVDMVHDRIQDSVANTPKESSDARNVVALKNTSKKMEENEFDSFAKYIVMQLRMLPRKNSAETQERILQLFEEKVEEEIVGVEPEDVYIIQVMDDKWDSNVPWVQHDTVVHR